MGSGELSITDNLEFFKHCADVGISDVSYIHRDTKQSSDRYEKTVEYLADKSPYQYTCIIMFKDGRRSNLNHYVNCAYTLT